MTARTLTTASTIKARTGSAGSIPAESAAAATRPGGRLLGYARVIRHDQDVTLQLDALRTAGCQLVWTEKASVATDARSTGRRDLAATCCIV
jgi:hypothetical protein